MGSWSVYCGYSNITITSGTSCVLLPLFNNEKNLEEILKYVPYSLPIFGKYNDYGGIEDIETNFNTEIIEKIHNCDIEDFCNLITDGEEELDEISDALKFVKENVTYMWLHRDIYDFLAKEYKPKGYHRAGSFDFGKKEILEKLGFTYEGESEDKRYKHSYKLDDKIVNSDGNWAHLVNGIHQEGLYNLETIKKYFPSANFAYFENKETEDLFELYDFKTRFDKLHYILGFSRSFLSNIDMFSIMKARDENKLYEKDYKNALPELLKYCKDVSLSNNETLKDFEKYLIEESKITPLQEAYFYQLDNANVCQGLADLIRLFSNGKSYSKVFEPYILYLTPQCGEHEIHQKILEKFVEINKTFNT